MEKYFFFSYFEGKRIKTTQIQKMRFLKLKKKKKVFAYEIMDRLILRQSPHRSLIWYALYEP